MELVDQVGVFVDQSGVEDVGEQVVIPVPVASVVEGDEEEVGTNELFQRCAAVGSEGDGVAESPGQPVEHRGVQQEGSDCVGLVVEHFLDEVCQSTWEVHDGVVDAYEGGYAAFVLAKAERARQASTEQAKRNNLIRKELAWLRRGAPARARRGWRTAAAPSRG